MDKLVTTDLILDWFKKAVEEKHPIDAHTWVDAGLKLNVLLGDETDLLLELQQKVADLRLLLIESGDSVAKAKAKIEATGEYKAAKKQEAKIDRILEMIRLAKAQARLKDAEFRNN